MSDSTPPPPPPPTGPIPSVPPPPGQTGAVPPVGDDPRYDLNPEPAWAQTTSAMSEIDGDDEEPTWSSSAKTIVAILSVLTLLGIGGTVWGLLRADDARDSAELTAEEAALLTERATTAEADLVELQTTTRTEINELTAERDQIQADLEEALADQERSEAEIQRLTAERDEVQEELDNLRALIEDVENPFPLTIDVDLTRASISGNYVPLLSEVSCDGFDFCGRLPTVGTSIITQDGGGVQLDVPGLTRIDFGSVGGQLFGSTVEQSVAGPCGGVARNSIVLANMYADDGLVQIDGSTTVSGLSVSVIIDSDEIPDLPECPRSRVWYQLQLDRAD